MREIVFKNEVDKVHRLELTPGLDWIHVSRRTTAFAGQTKEVTAQPQANTARSRARPYD